MTRRNIGSSYPFEDSFGYSRAVRVSDHVYVSGTTARGSSLHGSCYEQARAIFHLIEAALAEAGARMEHVVRTVVYVTSLSSKDDVTRAHGEVFGAIRPASTLVQVAGLTPSTALIEIEVTAVVTD